MKKAERNLTITETARVLEDIVLDYEAVRFTKEQFANLVGRKFIRRDFFGYLKDELFWNRTILIIPEYNESGDTMINLVVLSKEAAIRRCTLGRYCSNGTTLRTDSVNKMIRVYSNKTIGEG